MSADVTPIPKSPRAVKARKPVRRTRRGATALLKAKAIRLHSQYVRARDKRCVRCGRTDNLQCAHMVRRTYAATVTDEMNARALCGGCHLFVDSHHFEAVLFWTEQFGAEHYEATRVKAYAGSGTVMKEAFWAGECDRLGALLERVS